ncbi:sugar phosphate isomerase/epimerase family protein [Paenibacillus hamazuiensis]|uniref:sugar phosphate isomerase/epimerase family protein n=1 Tax=Paenibacillus hamazuiensis TaxID=2936508 RepID=UPI00200BB1CC|nr:TIM barrel protein [Paenibacillus hamazuiensis]
MMACVPRLNDGSGKPPRLEIHQSWWAMTGLGEGDREWTLEEKFEHIAKAGFTGIVARLPAPDQAERWRKLLDDYGFAFGIHSFPYHRSDLEAAIKEAKNFGADYINSQVADSFVTDSAAVSLLRDLVDAASKAGIPYFVETHRGRITQDLLRTVQYVRDVPDIRLTIDFSHYVVAGELILPNEKVEAYFDVLLKQTACFHGRISNGQQIQVDTEIGSDYIPFFLNWWKKGMNYWLQNAAPGDYLPFVCELGPPPYAIKTGAGQEISDRWTQALELKKLAESIRV